MNWQIKIAKRTVKQIKKFPKNDFEALLKMLEGFERNPFQGDIKKIKGEGNVWRRRMGNYRIIYEIFLNGKSVAILDIKRRTTNTY